MKPPCDCGNCMRCIRADRERIRQGGLECHAEERAKAARYRANAKKRLAPKEPRPKVATPNSPPVTVRPWEPEGPWPLPLTDPFLSL